MAEKKEKSKLVFGVTPLCEIAYAWLDKPQPGFKEKDTPRFSVTIKLDPAIPEHQAWMEDIKTKTGGKKVPFAEDKDSDCTLVKFHTFAKPPVVDSQNQLIVEGIIVGRSSTAHVAYALSGYEVSGIADGGFTLYLNAIQIVQLVKYMQKVQFEPIEDGYKNGDEVAEQAEEADNEQRGAGSDHPF